MFEQSNKQLRLFYANKEAITKQEQVLKEKLQQLQNIVKFLKDLEGKYQIFMRWIKKMRYSEIMQCS